MSGPSTAPAVSAARWKPNDRPYTSGSDESAMRASRGDVRTPLPKRSVVRATSTCGQWNAVASNSLPTADSP